MENIKQFLLQTKAASKEIDFCTDSKKNELEIEVCNYDEPITIKDKAFFAAVFIKYKGTSDFYAIELYPFPINKTSAAVAIKNIKENPDKYKNQ